MCKIKKNKKKTVFICCSACVVADRTGQVFENDADLKANFDSSPGTQWKFW